MKIRLYNPSEEKLSDFATPNEMRSCFGLLQSVLAPNIGGEQYDRLWAGVRLTFDEVEVIYRQVIKGNRDEIYEDTKEVIAACEILLGHDRDARIDFLSSHSNRETVVEQAIEGFDGRVAGNDASIVLEDVLRVYSAYFPDQLFEPTTKDNGLLLSADPLVNKASMERSAVLSAEQMVGILAASGIAFLMPRLAREEEEKLDPEVLDRIRETCAEERIAFRDSLYDFVQECHEKVQSGLYDDAWDFADKATNNKLRKKLTAYEGAIEKSGLTQVVKSTLLDSAGETVGIFGDLISGNLPKAAGRFLELLVNGYNSKKARDNAAAELRDISYVYEIRKALQ